MVVILDFREDLHKMSLEEALIKHNTNLKEVITEIIREQRRKTVEENLKKQKRKQDWGYLVFRKNRFYVQKLVDGKRHLIGTFRTMEDARLVRDGLIERDWNLDEIEEVLKETKVKRLPHRALLDNPNAYIYKNKKENGYIIRKEVTDTFGNRKTVTFGTYRTIEDARKIRDEMMFNYDWNKNQLWRAKKKHNIKARGE